MLINSICWTGGICPVCHFLARTAPIPDGVLAIACDKCGDFAISDEAEDVIERHVGLLDRSKLSEVVRDVCLIAECPHPLIDSLTASALIAFATV